MSLNERLGWDDGGFEGGCSASAVSAVSTVRLTLKCSRSLMMRIGPARGGRNVQARAADLTRKSAPRGRKGSIRRFGAGISGA